MQASMIFTSNDVVINLGVITAGVLVNWLDSSKPDLIIGTIVFILARGCKNTKVSEIDIWFALLLVSGEQTVLLSLITMVAKNTI